jgi:regulatory protein
MVGDCGNNMAQMPPRSTRRAPRPLNETSLRELALAYVGRFATTRRKLEHYLVRKIRERGWSGEEEADVAAIAEAFAEQGFIDDSGFALAKAQALSARGYGKRRLLQTLKLAGVQEEDGIAARDHADREAVAAALRFAQRRRIGPFGSVPASDRRGREKALAAMIRAGHRIEIARAILALSPGAEIDEEALLDSR